MNWINKIFCYNKKKDTIPSSLELFYSIMKNLNYPGDWSIRFSDHLGFTLSHIPNNGKFVLYFTKDTKLVCMEFLSAFTEKQILEIEGKVSIVKNEIIDFQNRRKKMNDSMETRRYWKNFVDWRP